MKFININPYVSVIIPSGRADRVFFTVKGILNQTIDRSKYEIIIVTPEPENMQELKEAGVRIIGVERLFAPGKMRNIGANVASGEILFLLTMTVSRRLIGWKSSSFLSRQNGC